MPDSRTRSGNTQSKIQKTVWLSITGAFALVGMGLGYSLGVWWTDQVFIKQSIRTVAGKNGAITALAGLVVFCCTYAGMWLARSANKLERVSAADKAAAIVGIILGMLIAALLASFAFPSVWFIDNPMIGWGARLILLIICCALCLALTLGIKDEFVRAFPKISALNDPSLVDADMPRSKLLDTNVIIDGRMTEIVKSGFVEGRLYIPSFVLKELQSIADSADSMRRTRGRRGLDVLQEMREQSKVAVHVYDKIDPAIERLATVDEKLVSLAKSINAAIITNDFNLNKVAVLQGVTVLNVNELANALKPVVLPGEELSVEIIKEGREENQGVGYLSDGTMVVVENGKRHIGETLPVSITSVYQTVAGKMIFGELKHLGHGVEKDEVFGESDSAHTSSRMRRPRRG